MAEVVLVAGTGTEVGKTWVACALVRALREIGVTVSARKPLQSYEPGTGATDGALLAAATGEPEARVTPPSWSYPAPLAPPMAADRLGREIPGLATVVDALDWPEHADLRLIEAVGGVRSPLTCDGDTVDLARLLAPRVVVLVARPDLGTLNDVRLCLRALRAHDCVVHLNRYDPDDELHRANATWLTDVDGADVVTSIDALASRLARGLGSAPASTSA